MPASPEPSIHLSSQDSSEHGAQDEYKQASSMEATDDHVLEPFNPRKDTEDNGDNDNDDFASAASISRTLSRRLVGAEDLYKEASHSTEPLPPMGGDKEYPPLLPDQDPYMVDFDGPDDPLFPHNWPLWKKIIICGAVGLSALSVSMGSAMFSESAEQLMMEYKIGWVVVTLGTSLFVFGFASGPVIWGPLSELYGRKTVLIPSCFGYICFCFMVGAAKDIQTIMICRFFAGFVGAAPLVAAPAAMADMFSATTRGNAMTNFAMVLFGGPMLAPICGGFTVKNSHLRWRFTSYFAGMVGVLALIAIVFFMDETHHGLILSRKAEILRRRTGNWGIHAAHDQVSLSIKEIVEKNISRPIVMLFTEPILFLITLYNAFIYGLLYLFLTAIPLIFVGGYHFSSGVGELPYLAMLIGEVIGGILSIFMERRYVRAVVANNGKPVPEERLPPMIVGSILFAIGIFWLGWTGNYASKVHWIVPTIGTAPIGMGLILIFLPCLNYIIDCYLFFAASALAGNTFLRSAFGAVFPLFAKQMFTNMKIKWATTLLGLISVVLIPVPVLFYKFGKRLRSKSKFAFDLD
ncbi:putative polyamine transporter [Clavispora lusitaniae]|uniref:Polyamine transporter n=1 Tax=Clavispora lusitaniae TaxID=36911 RepID=A0ACD0WSR7_CLALS|nr:Major facilitator super multidrug transporter flu1 [Clavispora lusitaniae]QFZ30396.1 putative polyamine transporter [Clavispora lusitaniae]QFZ36058.1 putative polyamine transporter [Clavispora lusitaniae]QFZ41742.1 putative polyamine transporter [Clavispora lusitaniae]QFZ47418.1 putative polyamine transporter [Clavispora lusitaniae]